MTELETSLNHFTSLNRASGATWTDATKRKAPHKPFLLLAVLNLVHRGVITSSFIVVTGDLVELNEIFNLYWRRIIPLGQTSSIVFPFSRLDREPFWELVHQPGTTITPAIVNNTSSVTYLRKYAQEKIARVRLFFLTYIGSKTYVGTTIRYCIGNVRGERQ